MRRRRYSRAVKIGFLANGFIWTIAVWGILFMFVLQGSQPLRIRVSALMPPATAHSVAQSPPVSLPDPTAAPLATPTATLVVVSSKSSPAPPNDPVPTVSPTRTPTPEPTLASILVEPLVQLSSPAKDRSTGPAPGGEAAVELTTSTGGPAASNAEVVPAALNQPASASTEPDGEQSYPASRPQPPPPTPVQHTGLPMRIVIDSINLDAGVIPVGWHTIFNGDQFENVWEVAEYAVGWHQNSARPGEAGNAVLTAHSNIKGEVFRYLADVEQGNIITVYVDGTPFEYKIDQTTVVKEAGEPLEVRLRNAQWIAPTRDERLTLVTCWPYPHSTHRLIVVAKPVRG